MTERMAQVPPCPSCGEDVMLEPAWACPSCRALHHRRCFEARGCSTQGCDRAFATRPPGSIVRVVIPGLVGALAVVLGMLPFGRLGSFGLAVELKTMAVFAGGMLGGVRQGAAVGLVVTAVQNLTNAPAAPYVVLAQALGFLIVGMAGGVAGVRRLRPVAYGLAGLLVTTVYQVLVNLGCWGTTGQPLWTVAVQAVAPPYFFTPVAIVSNGILFAVLLPRLRPALARCRSVAGL